MAWELVAIWIIVAATLVWFVRDEKRLQLEKLSARARYFATGAAWRHRESVPQAIPARPEPRGLTDIQRKFLEELRRRGR